MKIFQAFIVLASAIAAATGAAVRPAYGAPVYAQPSYDEPASYTYSYGVNDGYSGANFNADESRDGYATKGSYSVALPDGRVQTVTYNVDGYNGYVADVSYTDTGEAQYPCCCSLLWIQKTSEHTMLQSLSLSPSESESD